MNNKYQGFPKETKGMSASSGEKNPPPLDKWYPHNNQGATFYGRKKYKVGNLLGYALNRTKLDIWFGPLH